MDMELDPGVDPKYGSEAHELTPNMRWDIDGTWARDRVDPKLRSKSHNPNMDMELDLDPELTPSTMS